MDLFEWTVYGGIYLTGRKQFSLNIEEARHLKDAGNLRKVIKALQG